VEEEPKLEIFKISRNDIDLRQVSLHLLHLSFATKIKQMKVQELKSFAQKKGCRFGQPFDITDFNFTSSAFFV
jgi:hypothetical protein